MEKLRKPFQGILNVIRFNWHFYLLALGLVFFIWVFRARFGAPYQTFADVMVFLLTATVIISLSVSLYVYDLSPLYTFSWLDTPGDGPFKIINIHAGFDETSGLLKDRFVNSELKVFDFYDPVKHTEVSIRRARKAAPSYPGTQAIATDSLPVKSNSVDKVFLILSAHEIRHAAERILFFQELKRIIAPAGKIIVVEHTRDKANFLAYNLGFLHFHSRACWLQTFHGARLNITMELKITPFITAFILGKNGTAS